jgi:hypothetical protein
MNMASRESALWKWLAKAKLHYKALLHMNRLENKILAGMPDVEGCLDGKQFWLELKCGTAPAREETKVNIRVEDSQVEFMQTRLVAGGACGFLIRVKQNNSFWTFLIHGRHAYDLQRGLTMIDLIELTECSSKPTPEEIVLAATYLHF